MKLSPNILFADAKRERRQGDRAFTMVEIAIAIGVIGFALVAIIGILPFGMNVQKENREDTAISQDAPYFLDAIRNGATPAPNNASFASGLDFLTNYVEQIYFVSHSIVNNIDTVITNYPKGAYPVFSGAEIIGLLSTPEPHNVGTNYYIYNTAIIRSLGGAATEQGGSNSLMAFRYRLEVQVVPFNDFAPDTTNYNYYYSYGTNSPEYILRYNRWMEAQGTGGLGQGALYYNLFDVRLRFSWPVMVNGTNVVFVGPGRQTYRTMIAAQLASNYINEASGFVPVWYFQPQNYTITNALP